jgi:glycosyltransferase involved in cell wall biosynthesis
VLAPVPWFPFATRLFRRYRQRHGLPQQAQIGTLDVRYPRFLSIPRLFKPLDPIFLFLSVWREARRIRREFDFDLVDAHLAWPDGYGALLLARLLGKPLTLTLRGHDVNEFPRFPWRRRQIVAALEGADRVMSVANALRLAAIDLGCPEEKTQTVSNGVVADLFAPRSRDEARAALGLAPGRRLIVSVGHLVERKGHHLIVEALGRLAAEGRDDVDVAIVGGAGEEGDHRPIIEATRDRLGLGGRVILTGPRKNDELPLWYNAADVMCLASSKEGWANVLLESMACGTPVVATNVWGTPEVVCDPAYGVLVDRTPESIADGLARALDTTWDRERITAYARTHSWHDVAAKVERNYRLAIAAHAR